MGAASMLVLAIVLTACLAGGFAVLLRIALERARLVSRYDHIKAVMEYEEKLRVRQQKVQSSIAQEAGFIAQPAEEAEAVAVEAEPAPAGEQ